MFFGLAETITNQTVAVAVLIMILGGLGWLFRQMVLLAPSIFDRLDKQEEKRCEAMEKLAGRIEKAVEKLAENFSACMCDVKENIKESNRVKTLILAKLGSSGNNKIVKIKTKAKENPEQA